MPKKSCRNCRGRGICYHWQEVMRAIAEIISLLSRFQGKNSDKIDNEFMEASFSFIGCRIAKYCSGYLQIGK